MTKFNWKKWALRGVVVCVLGAVGVENTELGFTIADALSSAI